MTALACLFAVSLLAAPPRVEVSVGAGGSSNPFEYPEDGAATGANAPQPGAFVPLEVDLDFKTPPRSTFRARARGSFDGVFYGYVAQDPGATRASSASDANRWSAGAAFPLTFDPSPNKRDGLRMDFTLEPFVALNRETYTSHRSGRPLISSGVALGRRYDTNKVGVRTDADLALGRDFDSVFTAGIARVDYVEDYASSPEIDSWDHDEYRLDADLYGSPGALVLRAGYGFKLKDYDERFPRDANGNKVLASDPAYQPQTFVAHAVGVGGGLQGDWGKMVLAYGLERRLDDYVGYLDATSHRLVLDVELAVGAAVLEVRPSYSTRNYDAARVNYDPAAPETNRKRLALDAAFTLPIAKWTVGFVRAGVVDQTSSNPLFTYRAFSAMTGVRVSWQ